MLVSGAARPRGGSVGAGRGELRGQRPAGPRSRRAGSRQLPAAPAPAGRDAGLAARAAPLLPLAPPPASSQSAGRAAASRSAARASPHCASAPAPGQPGEEADATATALAPSPGPRRPSPSARAGSRGRARAAPCTAGSSRSAPRSAPPRPGQQPPVVALDQPVALRCRRDPSGVSSTAARSIPFQSVTKRRNIAPATACRPLGRPPSRSTSSSL